MFSGEYHIVEEEEEEEGEEDGFLSGVVLCVFIYPSIYLLSVVG